MRIVNVTRGGGDLPWGGPPLEVQPRRRGSGCWTAKGAPVLLAGGPLPRICTAPGDPLAARLPACATQEACWSMGRCRRAWSRGTLPPWAWMCTPASRSTLITSWPATPGASSESMTLEPSDFMFIVEGPFRSLPLAVAGARCPHPPARLLPACRLPACHASLVGGPRLPAAAPTCPCCPVRRVYLTPHVAGVTRLSCERRCPPA